MTVVANELISWKASSAAKSSRHIALMEAYLNESLRTDGEASISRVMQGLADLDYSSFKVSSSKSGKTKLKMLMKNGSKLEISGNQSLQERASRVKVVEVKKNAWNDLDKLCGIKNGILFPEPVSTVEDIIIEDSAVADTLDTSPVVANSVSSVKERAVTTIAPLKDEEASSTSACGCIALAVGFVGVAVLGAATYLI